MEITLYEFAFLRNVSSFFWYGSISFFFLLFRVCAESRSNAVVIFQWTRRRLYRILNHFHFVHRFSPLLPRGENEKERGGQHLLARKYVRRGTTWNVSNRGNRDGPTRLHPLLTAVAITKGWLRQEFVRSLNTPISDLSPHVYVMRLSSSAVQ